MRPTLPAAAVLSLTVLTACASKPRIPTTPQWLMPPGELSQICLPVFPDAEPLKGDPAIAWKRGLRNFQLQPGDMAVLAAVQKDMELAGEHPAARTIDELIGVVRGDEGAFDALKTRVDGRPEDPCLQQLGAIAAMIDGGHPDEARRWSQAAYTLLPDELPMALAYAMAHDGDPLEDRLARLDAMGDAFSRSHRVHRMRAQAHLDAITPHMDDEARKRHLDAAISSTKIMKEMGQDVGPTLMQLYRLADDRGAYLAEASRLGMPLGDKKAIALAADPEAAYNELLGVKEGETLTATFETSMGTIHCVLHPDHAPITVANFVGLARGTLAWTDPKTRQPGEGPWYDGTTFHRVIPEFMIQGGDRLGTGSGDPGYAFVNEVSPDVTFDRPGRLAMANAGPDTNGAQFFITEVPMARLNSGYTIFGTCEDADVVQAIARVPRGSADKPDTPVVLESLTIGTTR